MLKREQRGESRISRIRGEPRSRLSILLGVSIRADLFFTFSSSTGSNVSLPKICILDCVGPIDRIGNSTSGSRRARISSPQCCHSTLEHTFPSYLLLAGVGNLCDHTSSRGVSVALGLRFVSSFD